MKPKRNPDIDRARTTSDRVRIVLLLIAEHLPPHLNDKNVRPLLKHFEYAYGWRASTISIWIKQGFVPLTKGRLLHLHFSNLVSFNLEDICPPRKSKVRPRGINAIKSK